MVLVLVPVLVGLQTCTNTLEIPNYAKSMAEVARACGGAPPSFDAIKAHVDRKLSTAIEAGSSYGLDTVTQPSAEFGGGRMDSLSPSSDIAGRSSTTVRRARQSSRLPRFASGH